jgi:hypothetical protein
MGGALACIAEKRNAYSILMEKPEGRRPLGRPRRAWWTLLIWILKKQNGKAWTGLIWLRITTSGELM